MCGNVGRRSIVTQAETTKQRVNPTRKNVAPRANCIPVAYVSRHPSDATGKFARERPAIARSPVQYQFRDD